MIDDELRDYYDPMDPGYPDRGTAEQQKAYLTKRRDAGRLSPDKALQRVAQLTDELARVKSVDRSDFSTRQSVLRAQNAELQKELDACKANSEMYLWLKKRYLAVDFQYGEPGNEIAALVFEAPKSTVAFADLDRVIAAAMKE